MVESQCKEKRSLSYVTSMIDTFLILDVLNLKLGIINILPPNQPEKILLTACATKN